MSLTYGHQMIYKYEKPWWNNIEGAKLKNLEKTLSQCTLST
jgi:hypothetical protein